MKLSPSQRTPAQMDEENLEDSLVMAPSLGLRFSGINATMEALLPVMRKSIPIACCGANLSENMPRTTLWRWLRSKNRKQWRIWHARRNNDMLVGLFLRHIMRQKLILLFTSAAQREHTWLTKFCYQRMDVVIAATRKAASYLKRSSIVSHHGVDTTVFQPPRNRLAVKRSLGLQDKPTLGIFGRIRPQKGTGDLVQALVEHMPNHPDWHVVFIGAVTEEFLPYQKQLQQRLASSGLLSRVQFAGFLKNFSDLPRWYQAVDVVGCVSRNEGFGVTCLEGMASGTPVLATRAGAWEDIITPGIDGWLAIPGDAEDLGRALELMFSTNADQREAMGQKARSLVLSKFMIEHEVARITEVYRELFSKYQQDLPTIGGQHPKKKAA